MQVEADEQHVLDQVRSKSATNAFACRYRVQHGPAQGRCCIEALSVAYRGFYRLRLGDTAGLTDPRRCDGALSSDDIDPIVEGILYCNILWAVLFGPTGAAACSGVCTR